MTPALGLAQINSWVKAGSGNWEENQWSLGYLPGAGQTIMITNAGWKAVAIAPGTLNRPDSLTVYSINISSPPDSRNVLLFDYPGQSVPLATRFFTVASNSAVAMLNGALNLTGGGGEGMSIGGEFSQDAASTVLGSQMDIGYIGPGVYNLVSGNLWLQHVWVGGPYAGRMIQSGGTNTANILHLEAGGEYSLVDGDYNVVQTYFGSIYSGPGSFRQLGGRINTGLGVYRGIYRLEGGQVFGTITVPPSDGFSSSGGSGTMVQSGGTNLAALVISDWSGRGGYTLSNGVSRPPSIMVGANGSAEQWGGIQAISGTLSTESYWIGRQNMGHGTYTLHDGTLTAGGFALDGYYVQNGGLATVTGEVRMVGLNGGLFINGGELRSQAVSATSYGYAYGYAGYRQTGGRHLVSTRLTAYRESWQPPSGIRLEGGELLAPEMVLTPNAALTKTGGSVLETGLLTVTNGSLHLGTGNHRFGRLSLQTIASPTTNSQIFLPTSGSVVLSFADSHQVAWAHDATATIFNWNGLWNGGGTHQVFFGASLDGLTAGQAVQIRFHNPAGFKPGLYQGRMLSSGEIVPDALPPTGRVPATLTLSRDAQGNFIVHVRGELSANHGIDTSSNFVNWVRWTNASLSAQGTATVKDVDPYPNAKFYRAELLP